MSKSYILQAFVETPWAILPNKLAALEDIVLRHVAGEKLTAEEIQARIHGATRPADRRIKNVAVLPVFGTIFPRANLMTDVSGAASSETLGKQFAALVNDNTVDAIVLDVNSPGGQVSGVTELASQIYAARGKKPIIAVANHMMASAAYWIASAADQIVVSPSGEVGSIGVFAAHQDMSARMAQDGVKMTIIKAGRFKAEGNPYEPLTEETLAAIQAKVNETYDAFVAAVAQHRGVSAETVRTDFGEGRMVSAVRAVELGMADRVATLDETIAALTNGELSTGTGRQAPAASEANQQVLMLEAELRLLKVKDTQIGANMNSIRELQKAHQSAVNEAKAVFDAAEAESRLMTPEEQAKFDENIAKAEDLKGQIAKVQADNERLREAALAAVASEAEKPAPAPANPTILSRAEFDKLNPEQKAAFFKNNGKLTE